MILAINTSTPQFSLAILKKDGTVLVEYLMCRKKGDFGSVMPALDLLLSNLGATIRDQQAIVVATGPGSFTGLRLGISMAKGLCHGLGIPIIGVPTLDALASQLPYSRLPVTAVVYAKKNEVYGAQYLPDDNRNLAKIMEDTAIHARDLPGMIRRPCIFIGNDFSAQAPMLKQAMGDTDVQLAPANLWNVKASALGTIGLKRFHANDMDDLMTLGPVYIRPPDIRANPYPLVANRKSSDI